MIRRITDTPVMATATTFGKKAEPTSFFIMCLMPMDSTNRKMPKAMNTKETTRFFSLFDINEIPFPHIFNCAAVQHPTQPHRSA